MRRKSSLERAFVEDHKHLTRGFAEILEALETNDWPRASRAADEIDRLVGAHIEFEERFLYPEVGKVRGEAYATCLYDEHDVALDAIRALESCDPEAGLSSEEKARVARAARTGLDHAIHCGTLLSHLTTLEPSRQSALEDELLELRRRGRRWTDESSR